jgi:hypothetical protein
MNNCTQWSSVYTIVLWLKLRVQMGNAYLKCVDSQESRAGAERMDGTKGYGKAMPGEVLWRAEWASPMATATTI